MAVWGVWFFGVQHRAAVWQPVRQAVHAVCPLDPAVAPPAQPLDPGLATGLRRHSRSQRRHPRQPLLSVGADLLRLRWRQENQGIHLDKYGFPLAITVSTANRHDSK